MYRLVASTSYATIIMENYCGIIRNGSRWQRSAVDDFVRLYWIKFSNSSSCNHTDYLESSRVDGSERRIVVRPHDCYYYRAQAIDFFGGAVYSYSRDSRNIFKIVVEGVPNIITFAYLNHFVGCSWYYC